MRFHLLGIPNAPVAQGYSLDGFSQATLKFSRMLKELGHYVYLYAPEGSEAQCDELVVTLSEEERSTLIGDTEYQYAMMEAHYPLWALSNPRTIKEIAKRKQPRDFICSIGGASQKPIADAHPGLMFVEYSIGYVSSFAKYRVYESHIWRHCTHGFQDDQQGRFFDAVIPYFFDTGQFPFRDEKEPFALYVGRLTPRKGLAIACQAARLAGVPLKVIGHGDTELVTDGAEYLGPLGDADRNEWMSRASCLLCPTLYLEPFGATAVEAQLCGTPAISTDFGAFVETVEQGVSGFRCNYLAEFTEAIKMAPTLNPARIRERAVKNYSMGVIKWQYERYFQRLMLLWEGGFYSGLDRLGSF